MKLLLVSPGWPKGRLWGESGFKFPLLSLAAVASPPAGWEVFLCDENLEPHNLEAEVDLVGISAMTPQAPRAYQIAAPFRARGDIYSGKNYLLTNTIQTTRGCPNDCEFCSVTSFYGRRYREKPLDLVLAVLETLKKSGSFVFFVDDNLIANRRYPMPLFSGMRGMGLRRHSRSPIDFALLPRGEGAPEGGMRGASPCSDRCATSG